MFMILRDATSLFFVLSVLLLSTHYMQGQDQNWGVKVKCFVMAGTVVCPGCNVRAGLFCPRRPKDKPEFDSCERETTTELPTTTTVMNATLKEEDDSTDGTDRYLTEMENALLTNPHVLLYLYRRIDPMYPLRPWPRFVRSVDTSDPDEGLEVCGWTGDCPCPLLCCPRGRGCPNRCVMGIRMHPHVYPYRG